MVGLKSEVGLAAVVLLIGLLNLSNDGCVSAQATSTSTVYNMDNSASPGQITWLLLLNLNEGLGVPDAEAETSPNMTICMWFSLNRVLGKSTLLSYAISDAKTSVLQLDLEGDKLSFTNENGQTNSYELASGLEPSKWYHTCMVLEKEEGDSGDQYHISLYFDGALMKEFEDGELFPVSGTLLIGEDHDTKDAILEAGTGFYGKASVAMFLEGLEESDVDDLYQCESEIVPLSVSWLSASLVTTKITDICEDSGPKPWLMPFKTVDGYQAENLCSVFDSATALPQSQEENDQMRDILSPASECSGSPAIANNRGWLGIHYDASTDSAVGWENLTEFVNTKLDHTNFQTGHIILNDNGNWDTEQQVEGCPLCQGLPSSRFYLYGFCPQSASDAGHMVLYPRVSDANVLCLHSLVGISIRKDGKWKLFDDSTNTALLSTDDSFFVGEHNWDIIGSVNCPPLPTSGTMKLFITKCSIDEFTCNNGQCIPLSGLCNSVRECSDNSDETACNTVDIPSNYEKNSPPPQFPLQLLAEISIAKVASISSNDEAIQVTTAMKLYWSDSRLNYNNLYADYQHGRLRHLLQDIWLPNIMITPKGSTCDLQTSRGSCDAGSSCANLWVKKEYTSTRIGNGYRYSGSGNRLVYQIEQSNQLHCHFHLMQFPFDHVHCRMDIHIDNLPASHIQLAGSLAAIGRDSRLSNYDIVSTRLDTDGDVLILKITLNRISSFYIASTFVPVIFIQTLVIGTLFINVQDFKSRMGMSLLLLLILTVKYSDSMATSPKTSFMDYMDSWYLFHFVFTFIVVLVHWMTMYADLGPCSDIELRKVVPTDGTTASALSSNSGNRLQNCKLWFRRYCGGQFGLNTAGIVLVITHLIFYLTFVIVVAVSP